MPRTVAAVLTAPLRDGGAAPAWSLMDRKGSRLWVLSAADSSSCSPPDSIDGVAAVEQLRQHWPEGTLLTLDVIVTNAGDPATDGAVEQLKADALKINGLSGPPKVTKSSDGTVYDVALVMSGTQNDPRNQEIVSEVRSNVVPPILEAWRLPSAYVTGDAASTMDRTRVYTDSLPLVFGFVLSLSFLLLLIAFRSVVVPIKAIVLNLLSTFAAYGVMVAVFEFGFGKEILDVRPTEVIEAFVPIFVFAILFGLSMDYHVFILARIRELVDKGSPTTFAVARGIALTSGTVTSAAAIMVVRIRRIRDAAHRGHPRAGAGPGSRRADRRHRHSLGPLACDDAPAGRVELVSAAWLGWLPRVTLEAPESRNGSGRYSSALTSSASRRFISAPVRRQLKRPPFAN